MPRPASEFRYRNPVIEPDTLYVAVSQSGETFDTLAAVQEIKRKGGRVIGVVNTPGKHHRSRVRVRGLPPCRHGGLRGLHQDLHLDRGRVRPARPASGPDPRHRPGRRHPAHPGPRGAALPDRTDPGPRGRHRRHRHPSGRRLQRLLHRPGAHLPGGPRRCPEAEGGLLHPRRGLSRRRAQARSAGPGGRGHPDGGADPGQTNCGTRTWLRSPRSTPGRGRCWP